VSYQFIFLYGVNSSTCQPISEDTNVGTWGEIPSCVTSIPKSTTTISSSDNLKKDKDSSKSGSSVVVAGVIGFVIALVLCGIAFAIFFVLIRKKYSKNNENVEMQNKGTPYDQYSSNNGSQMSLETKDQSAINYPPPEEIQKSPKPFNANSNPQIPADQYARVESQEDYTRSPDLQKSPKPFNANSNPQISADQYTRVESQVDYTRSPDMQQSPTNNNNTFNINNQPEYTRVAPQRNSVKYN